MIPARGLGRTFLDIRAWSYVSYRKEMMEEYRVYFYVVSVIGILAIYLANSPVLLATAQNETIKLSYPNATMNDTFGIAEIYPTQENGREWYLNMNNPLNDSLFSITFDPNITRQIDGSWRISETNSSYSNPQIRMNVDTSGGSEPWRDVEMTGYIKIIPTNMSRSTPDNTINSTQSKSGSTSESSTHESEIEDIAWYARGGKRNDVEPCEGTGYFGGFHPDGTVSWKKSIWWTGGYTEERLKQKVFGGEMTGKWIGWKVVMYNIEVNNTTAVKMESYLDINNDGKWSRVTDLIDNGGWYARTSDTEFYGAGCNKPKDYIVTNSGPIATFRADNMVLDFKDLSIREIEPSSNFNRTSVVELA
ncbi:MAG: hypothetical protein WBP83_12935 [Nitrososphaeraceae archaeon]